MKKNLVAISILIVAICVGGLFVYFQFRGPALINKDPSTLTLSSGDVPYPLGEGSYMSIKDVAEGEHQSEYQLEQWGYDRGYATFFIEGNEITAYSIVLRFSSINGADSAFDAICSAHGAEYETLTSPEIGDESNAYGAYEMGEKVMHIILFRKANIFVDVGARLRQSAEMYAQIIEDRI